MKSLARRMEWGREQRHLGSSENVFPKFWKRSVLASSLRGTSPNDRPVSWRLSGQISNGAQIIGKRFVFILQRVSQCMTSPMCGIFSKWIMLLRVLLAAMGLTVTPKRIVFRIEQNFNGRVVSKETDSVASVPHCSTCFPVCSHRKSGWTLAKWILF